MKIATSSSRSHRFDQRREIERDTGRPSASAGSRITTSLTPAAFGSPARCEDQPSRLRRTRSRTGCLRPANETAAIGSAALGSSRCGRLLLRLKRLPTPSLGVRVRKLVRGSRRWSGFGPTRARSGRLLRATSTRRLEPTERPPCRWRRSRTSTSPARPLTPRSCGRCTPPACRGSGSSSSARARRSRSGDSRGSPTAPPPAASRRAPLGASGPPRSRSAARRSSRVLLPLQSLSTSLHRARDSTSFLRRRRSPSRRPS